MLFIGLALFTISGGHWALMQGIAYAGMIRVYSSEGSLSSTIEKTFNGNSPCSFCKKIAQAKKKERTATAALQKSDKKIVGILELSPVVLSPNQTAISFFKLIASTYAGPIIRPPIPYPRSAAAV